MHPKIQQYSVNDHPQNDIHKVKKQPKKKNMQIKRYSERIFLKLFLSLKFFFSHCVKVFLNLEKFFDKSIYFAKICKKAAANPCTNYKGWALFPSHLTSWK